MRIVFMGTPDFAVASLEAILNTHCEIVAVVTTPDKPAGRGKHVNMSEVKKYALSKNLTILQPEKLKDPEFVEILKSLNADVFVVVAFRMLPETVYSIPPKGSFNIHASILPEYRGAAPIHWAVINGETKTGVTSFFLNNEIDKGDIIDCYETEIGPTETTGELYDKLKLLGAELAVNTLDNIEKNSICLKSQISIQKANLKIAPKINKEDAKINWKQNANTVFNKIRGMSPFPCAFSSITKKTGDIETVKIYQCEMTSIPSSDIAGTISIIDDKIMLINTADMQISIKKLQIQGKKMLSIEQFLIGFRQNNYILKMI